MFFKVSIPVTILFAPTSIAPLSKACLLNTPQNVPRLKKSISLFLFSKDFL